MTHRDEAPANGRMLFDLVVTTSAIARGRISALVVCEDGVSLYLYTWREGCTPANFLGPWTHIRVWRVRPEGEVPIPADWARYWNIKDACYDNVPVDIVRSFIWSHGGDSLTRVPITTQRRMREWMETIPKTPCPSEKELRAERFAREDDEQEEDE